MEIMYCTTEKTKIFAEPGAFEPMIKQAEALIEAGGFKGNRCANAIVVMTAKGNIFGAVTEDGRKYYESCADKVFEQLADSQETEVKRIVCLWDGGPLDISSHYFRKKLYDLNKNNKNAEVLLGAENGYHIRALEQAFGKNPE